MIDEFAYAYHDDGSWTCVNVVDRKWDANKCTWMYTLIEDFCNGQRGEMYNGGEWVEEKHLGGSGNDGD